MLDSPGAVPRLRRGWWLLRRVSYQICCSFDTNIYARNINTDVNLARCGPSAASSLSSWRSSGPSPAPGRSSAIVLINNNNNNNNNNNSGCSCRYNTPAPFSGAKSGVGPFLHRTAAKQSKAPPTNSGAGAGSGNAAVPAHERAAVVRTAEAPTAATRPSFATRGLPLSEMMRQRQRQRGRPWPK